MEVAQVTVNCRALAAQTNSHLSYRLLFKGRTDEPDMPGFINGMPLPADAGGAFLLPI